MTTLAYHDDAALKVTVLDQLKAHRLADELVKGQYWENGKGCAIGCLVHSSDHALVTERFGWPLPIAYLTDTIFEGLPNGKSKEWPERIASAIRPGQDLRLVHWQFMHWLLTDEKVNPGINHPLVRDAVKQCALVVGRKAEGKRVTEGARSAAWSFARSAAWSFARSAAWSAAWSAESAAWSAAWSAESAAWSAARSAARSAAWSFARSAAWSAARSAAYVLMADKLIELIEAAP